jgi:hypothetical protein
LRDRLPAQLHARRLRRGRRRSSSGARRAGRLPFLLPLRLDPAPPFPGSAWPNRGSRRASKRPLLPGIPAPGFFRRFGRAKRTGRGRSPRSPGPGSGPVFWPPDLVGMRRTGRTGRRSREADVVSICPFRISRCRFCYTALSDRAARRLLDAQRVCP